MIRLLLFALLFYIGYRIIVSLTSARNPSAKSAGSHNLGEETYRDPVCGVYVTEKDAVIGRHDGQRRYFCSMDCLEKYREQLDHF